MFCIHCGSQLLAHHRFCTSCGRVIASPVAPDVGVVAEPACTARRIMPLVIGAATLLAAATAVIVVVERSKAPTPPVTARPLASHLPAVLTLNCYNDQGDAVALGSGFIIQANGIGVTNWHVIAAATGSVKVTTGSGDAYEVHEITTFD
ncbi:MAG: hypothetical protein DMF86_04005, partial [Acidobacteria bacterium]